MSDEEHQSLGNVANTAAGGAEQVVQARDIAGDVHLHGATASTLPRPRQLPRGITHFTGRDAELAKLDALLDIESGRTSTVVISAIAGTAGIGKTSLAVHWAHRVQSQFPDGQLYVNLRGYDSDLPLTADHALDSFLRALGLSVERIPGDVDAKAGAYRSLLAGRRVLVVLDNAASADQIRPLLPNETTCLVLVTSRSRLSGLVAHDGAHRISLDFLTPNEAYALLSEVIGRDRTDLESQATGELARRCAYLPLALRIAAERVTSRPHFTVADLVHDLALEHRRLDVLATDDDENTAVRSVFSSSYRALPREAARAFRLLGIHPGPSISLAAAAALADTNLAETRRHLDTLVGVHLLIEISRDRYQFHDLLRTYAAECARLDEPGEPRDAAIQRLFEWYLHTAHAALFAYSPKHPEIPIDSRKRECRPLAFTDRDHARSWFAAEHDNLLALIRHAPVVGQYTVGWQLPNAVDAYLGERPDGVDRIAIHRLGLAAAQQVGSPIGEAWAWGHLGAALQSARRFDDAITCHQQELKISGEIGHKFGQGAALGSLALCNNELERYAEAADYSKRALRIYRSIGHQRNEALALVKLGNALRGMGELEQAATRVRQGLDIVTAIDVEGTIGWALQCLARIKLEQGRADEAVSHLKQAAVHFQGLHLDHNYAQVLGELGAVLHDMGFSEQARQKWQEAHIIFTELDPHQAAQIQTRLDALGPAEGTPFRS